MNDAPLSERPVLLLPAGDWHNVFDGVDGRDIHATERAIKDDFSVQTGFAPPVTFHGDYEISGQGAEAPFFVMDLWPWIGGAADTVTLAALGLKLLSHLARTNTRLFEVHDDPAEASKMRPLVAGPLMRLVAAKYATDSDQVRAVSLEEWKVEPLFQRMIASDTWFHAQQSYLVTGLGRQDAFISVYDACASPRTMLWVDSFHVRSVGS